LELKKFEMDWSYSYVVYEKALRLLHPLMPFITEELWQRLETGGKSIALASYPFPEPDDFDEDPEYEMNLFWKNVTQIRQDRAANKIDRGQTLSAELQADGTIYKVFRAHKEAFERIANVALDLREGWFLPLKLNIPVDRARLEKENAELEKQIASLERQFADQESLAKKPEKVVAGMREKKAAYEAQLAKNRAAL
jgi:valyl-tRNA synthetase